MGNIEHDDDEPTTREWVQALVSGPEAESIISTIEWFEREVARLTAANRGAVDALRAAEVELDGRHDFDADARVAVLSQVRAAIADAGGAPPAGGSDAPDS